MFSSPTHWITGGRKCFLQLLPPPAQITGGGMQWWKYTWIGLCCLLQLGGTFPRLSVLGLVVFSFASVFVAITCDLPMLYQWSPPLLTSSSHIVSSHPLASVHCFRVCRNPSEAICRPRQFCPCFCNRSTDGLNIHNYPVRSLPDHKSR